MNIMNETQHIPAGYKLSPLGPIPEDWEVKRLGDLCENKGDYGLNAPATDYSVNLPTYLRITDIDDNGNFIHSTKKSVDNLSAKEYYLKDGDIVFARTGATVGKTYLYDVRDGQLVYAGFLIKFSPNPNKLIPYYLKAHTETKDYTNWVAITSQRSGQPGINAAEYCSLKLAIPPIEEQERICNVLQLWDTAISKQAQLVEKLTLRKRGLMQQLLTGKKRLKGFGGEWGYHKIQDHFTEIRDKNDGKGHIPMTISAKVGLVSQTHKFDRIVAGNSLDKYTLLHKGDFAYNKGNSNLYEMGCIYRLKEESAVVPFVYICFRVVDDTCCEFYQQFFINHGLDKQLKQIITSGARGDGLLNVNSEDFMALKIPYPPIKEQQAIASILNNADKEIELANKKLARLQEEKKGLMQVLLTGKKRITY